MRRGLPIHVVAACLLATAALAAEPAPLRVDGQVKTPLTLTMADLKGMPAIQADITSQTMHGAEHHVWSGVPLWALIGKAALVNDPGKNAALRHTILVHGQDGYVATLAIGEIDPALEGKSVLIALQSDNKDLTAPRLIVPGDKHAARAVHDVVEIEVK